MTEAEARVKARYVMRLVQGTCALSGQAVDQAALAEMEERTVKELLAGVPEWEQDDGPSEPAKKGGEAVAALRRMELRDEARSRGRDKALSLEDVPRWED